MSSPSTSPRSRPLDIPGRRRRSGSESSEASVSMAETPGKSPASTPPRVKIQTNSGVPTSPILSFFFPGSPTKTPGSLFARPPPTSGSAVIEDDDSEPNVLPASAHARRFSNSWAKTLPSIASPTDDRGSGLMRRLSLSSTFGRPIPPGTHAGGTTPPNTSPVVQKAPIHVQKDRSPRASPSPGPAHRMRRSATIAVPNATPPRARAPSPMGERILKGHFDGFV
ncbi:hypothetical protein BKA62DRAFT_448257 [Auriculariales sp. MPI-PUGE-AT-0066]|nr:hypothetical protein BKA62DRAFT_448257 [Auriculariales sp. MPI-PUGE-AT-0066]